MRRGAGWTNCFIQFDYLLCLFPSGRRFSDFEPAGGAGSEFAGRRLRTKVMALTGTMSKAPSQDSALALLFFAAAFPADCD